MFWTGHGGLLRFLKQNKASSCLLSPSGRYIPRKIEEQPQKRGAREGKPWRTQNGQRYWHTFINKKEKKKRTNVKTGPFVGNTDCYLISIPLKTDENWEDVYVTGVVDWIRLAVDFHRNYRAIKRFFFRPSAYVCCVRGKQEENPSWHATHAELAQPLKRLAPPANNRREKTKFQRDISSGSLCFESLSTPFLKLNDDGRTTTVQSILMEIQLWALTCFTNAPSRSEPSLKQGLDLALSFWFLSPSFILLLLQRNVRLVSSGVGRARK